MDYFELAYNTEDLLEKIQDATARNAMNDHLDSISSDGCLPVDENFPYIPGPWLRFCQWCDRTFFLRRFTTRLNRQVFHTRVEGRENLKKLKGAVFVCNHINKFDGLIYDYAVNFKKTKIMVAEFNNRPGFLGKIMRADGIMPFKPERKCIKKFNDAVNYYLQHGTNVLFFPEGSEWWCYKKPRPMANGAFHYAAGNNVPVVPMFITYSVDPSRLNEGDEIVDGDVRCIRTKEGRLVPPDMTVHILPPVYPDKDLNKAENVAKMKEKAESMWQEAYTKAY